MSDISRWIAGHAAERPEVVAIHDDFQSLTYGELEQRISAAAHYLTDDLELSRGDAVAWLGHNVAEQLVLIFAAARAGLVIVPLNWRLAAPELAHIIEDCGARALIHQQAYGELAPTLLPASGICRAASCGDLPARTEVDVRTVGAMDDPLLLVYTSGTTGRAKGAILSQRAVEVNTLNSQHMHNMTADDLILTVLPMFHVGGLNIQTLPGLYCGAQVRLHERFEPQRVLAAIGGNSPSLTCLVPATIQALVNQPEWQQTDVSSLRAVATGSTDVPLSAIEAFHSRGVPVIQVYGSTETGPVCMYQRSGEAFETVGSIGRCGLHSEIRLAGPDGEDVALGEPGEILVKGGNVASAYWRDVGQTDKSFRDGWFHSGDVATCDQDGLYWFKDRIKHVIISGGENIYPAELERVLRALPGISEAAIIGLSDAKWGQVPIAVVVADDPNLSEADVLSGFEGQLARFKHPKRVVFTQALPRNDMGKVVLEAVEILAARALDAE